MPKDTNTTKKTGTSFDLTIYCLIQKCQTISAKFKIHISQLIDKISTQMTNSKPNQALFGRKYLSKFVSFMTKVNPNHENDTK